MTAQQNTTPDALAATLGWLDPAGPTPRPGNGSDRPGCWQRFRARTGDSRDQL